MEAQERHQTTPVDLGARSKLLIEKHASYIKRVADVRAVVKACITGKGGCRKLLSMLLQSRDSLESHVTEHFRLSGVYWGLTALYLMGRLDMMDGAAIVEWVRHHIALAHHNMPQLWEHMLPVKGS